MSYADQFDPSKPLPAHVRANSDSAGDRKAELYIWRVVNMALAAFLGAAIWGYPAFIFAALVATILIGSFLVSLMS